MNRRTFQVIIGLASIAALENELSQVLATRVSIAHGRGNKGKLVIHYTDLDTLDGVLERLRADPRTELLPVVMLTSSDEQRDRLGSYENGCNSFVQKPVDFAEFADTVARLGVYWLATNEPPLQR